MKAAKRGALQVRASTAGAAQRVQPATIVGSGRLGSALQQMGNGEDEVVGRDQPISEGGSGPIFVSTRNDDLEGVLQQTPPSRREDLVFMQNGMLLPWLRHHSLHSNTQALIYFAVAKLNEPPVDGVTVCSWRDPASICISQLTALIAAPSLCHWSRTKTLRA
jgi:hypothetical protein